MSFLYFARSSGKQLNHIEIDIMSPFHITALSVPIEELLVPLLMLHRHCEARVVEMVASQP